MTSPTITTSNPHTVGTFIQQTPTYIVQPAVQVGQEWWNLADQGQDHYPGVLSACLIIKLLAPEESVQLEIRRWEAIAHHITKVEAALVQRYLTHIRGQA